MTSPISTVTIPLPPPDLREIRRYAACPQGAETELAAALSELSDLQGRVSYRTFSVRQDGDLLDLGFAAVCSHDLCRALQGAEHVLLFAATLGIRPDRLLARYSRLSPAKAVLLQAICTERIEALLDRFCQMQQEALAQQNAVLLPRFSPGYGDLPLELQDRKSVV